jgi:hypothetical protein
MFIHVIACRFSFESDDVCTRSSPRSVRPIDYNSRQGGKSGSWWTLIDIENVDPGIRFSPIGSCTDWPKHRLLLLIMHFLIPTLCAIPAMKYNRSGLPRTVANEGKWSCQSWDFCVCSVGHQKKWYLSSWNFERLRFCFSALSTPQFLKGGGSPDRRTLQI